MQVKQYIVNKANKVYIETDLQELCLINNALSEVCYGIELSENEFINRLGASYEDITMLLKDVQSIIKIEQNKEDK
jgi:hypothetical protein